VGWGPCCCDMPVDCWLVGSSCWLNPRCGDPSGSWRLSDDLSNSWLVGSDYFRGPCCSDMFDCLRLWLDRDCRCWW